MDRRRGAATRGVCRLGVHRRSGRGLQATANGSGLHDAGARGHTSRTLATGASGSGREERPDAAATAAAAAGAATAAAAAGAAANAARPDAAATAAAAAGAAAATTTSTSSAMASVRSQPETRRGAARVSIEVYPTCPHQSPPPHTHAHPPTRYRPPLTDNVHGHLVAVLQTVLADRAVPEGVPVDDEPEDAPRPGSHLRRRGDHISQGGDRRVEGHREAHGPSPDTDVLQHERHVGPARHGCVVREEAEAQERGSSTARGRGTRQGRRKRYEARFGRENARAFRSLAKKGGRVRESGDSRWESMVGGQRQTAMIMR